MVGFVDTSLVLWLFPWACGLGSNFFPFLSYFFFCCLLCLCAEACNWIWCFCSPFLYSYKVGCFNKFWPFKKTIVGVEFGLKWINWEWMNKINDKNILWLWTCWKTILKMFELFLSKSILCFFFFFLWGRRYYEDDEGVLAYNF